MSKSYLSGAAKRQTREERAKKAAKMPKISAFLKLADSTPAPTDDYIRHGDRIELSFDQSRRRK
jgi:hypothetical protein